MYIPYHSTEMLQSLGISMCHYSQDKMDNAALQQVPFPLEFPVLSWTKYIHVRHIFILVSNSGL